jgi:hypothetical protein
MKMSGRVLNENFRWYAQAALPAADHTFPRLPLTLGPTKYLLTVITIRSKDRLA